MKNQSRSINVYKYLLAALFAIVFATAASTQLSAQETASNNPRIAVNTSTYKHAVGLRAGGTSGLTYKYFLTSSSALEFIAWGHRDAIAVTGLYERYAPAFNVAGMNWYYGGGAHVRAYSDGRYPEYYTPATTDDVGIGIDGIVGLEYKIAPIPFAVSIDLKPFVEATTHGQMHWAIDPGIGLKFTF